MNDILTQFAAIFPEGFITSIFAWGVVICVLVALLTFINEQT